MTVTSLSDTPLKLTNIVQRRHRVYDTSQLILFTKVSRWYTALPNGRICISPKVVRSDPGRDPATQGSWYTKTLDGAYKLFNDTRYKGSYYLALAATLEEVLQMLDNGQLSIKGLTIPRSERELPAGVTLMGPNRGYRAQSYEYDELFLKPAKLKTSHTPRLELAEAFVQDVRGKTIRDLRKILMERIHLLKTNPNGLPIFNPDDFKLIKVNVAKDLEKQSA